MVGRPRCTKACCSKGCRELLRGLYCSQGLSSDEIGEKIGVSDNHIIERLHTLKIKVRGRGCYRKKREITRRGVLWKISDKELFFTPIKELALKYHFSHSGVEYVRRERREEETD